MSSDGQETLLSTKHLAVALLQPQKLVDPANDHFAECHDNTNATAEANLPQPMAAQQIAAQAMLLHSHRSLPESGSILHSLLNLICL